MRPAIRSLVVVLAHLGYVGVGQGQERAQAQPSGDAMSSFDLRVHEGVGGSTAYRLFTPPAWSEPRRLLVVLHGCTQDSEDVAVGTGMNVLASEGGFAVLYPEQSEADHPQRCWTWYERAQQDPGGREVSRIHGLVRAATEELEVGSGNVYLAGISAGGAMANVLAVVHPGDFAGLAVHSGVAFGAAGNVTEALSAMQQGGPPDALTPDAPRLAAVKAAATPRRIVVIHGGADPVVRPVNGDQVAAQWAGILDARSRASGAAGLEVSDEEASSEVNGRGVRLRRWKDAEGTDRVLHVVVDGLGHAWSGGDPAGTYSDPRGPSASRMMASFLGLLR